MAVTGLRPARGVALFARAAALLTWLYCQRHKVGRMDLARFTAAPSYSGPPLRASYGYYYLRSFAYDANFQKTRVDKRRNS